MRLVGYLFLLSLACATSCGTPLRLSDKMDDVITITAVSGFKTAGGNPDLRRNEGITITLDDDIDPSTITADMITVTRADGTTVPGTLSYDAATRTLTFTPTELYPANEVLTVTFDAHLKKLDDGSRLDYLETKTFTTSAYSIGTLAVSTVSPADGTTGLSFYTNFRLTFNEDVDRSSLTSSTIKAYLADGTEVMGTITYNSTTKTVTFKPDSAWPENTSIKLVLDANIKKASDGTVMASRLEANFTTGSASASGSLAVTSFSPAANTTGVDFRGPLKVTFNADVDPDSLIASSFLVKDSQGNILTGKITYDSATKTAFFRPDTAFPEGDTLTMTIDTHIAKADDKTIMTSTPSVSFSTEVYTRGSLALNSFTPEQDDTTLPNNGPVVLKFNAAIDPASVDDETLRITDSNGDPIPGKTTLDVSTNTLTFTPDSDYPQDETLTVIVDQHIKNLSDSTIMTKDTTFTFKNTSSVFPSVGDLEIDLAEPIVIKYAKSIDPTSIDPNLVKVYKQDMTPVPVTFTYDDTTKTISFVPTSTYPSDEKLIVVIDGKVKAADDSSEIVTKGSSTFTTLDSTTLLAQWKFDNATTDSSGNGTTLTNNGVAFSSTDKVQGSHAAYFDGQKHYLQTPAAFNLGSTFTVTIWVKLDSPIKANINTILSNGDGGVPLAAFKLFINEYATSNLRVATEGGNGTTGALMLTTSNFITTGSWKHFAFVINKGAAQGSRSKIYFNGVKAVQTAHSANLPDLPNDFDSNRQLRIGEFFNYLAQDNFSYKGFMDDLRIYNTLLTDEQIAQIATQH